MSSSSHGSLSLMVLSAFQVVGGAKHQIMTRRRPTLPPWVGVVLGVFLAPTNGFGAALEHSPAAKLDGTVQQDWGTLRLSLARRKIVSDRHKALLSSRSCDEKGCTLGITPAATASEEASAPPDRVKEGPLLPASVEFQQWVGEGWRR